MPSWIHPRRRVRSIAHALGLLFFAAAVPAPAHAQSIIVEKVPDALQFACPAMSNLQEHGVAVDLRELDSQKALASFCEGTAPLFITTTGEQQKRLCSGAGIEVEGLQLGRGGGGATVWLYGNRTLMHDVLIRRQVNRIVDAVKVTASQPSGTIPAGQLRPPKAQIAPGGSLTLQWISKGASFSSIEPNVLGPTCAQQGEVSVSPNTTTIYTLVLRSRDGSLGPDAPQAEVTVVAPAENAENAETAQPAEPADTETTPPSTTTPVPPDAKPSGKLKAHPEVISEGEATTLSWESANAARVVITDGVNEVLTGGGPSGSVTIWPTANTTYILQLDGRNADFAGVEVLAPAAPPYLILALAGLAIAGAGWLIFRKPPIPDPPSPDDTPKPPPVAFKAVPVDDPDPPRCKTVSPGFELELRIEAAPGEAPTIVCDGALSNNDDTEATS